MKDPSPSQQVIYLMKMDVLIISLFASQIAIELLGYHKLLWPFRRYLLFVHMLLIGISSGLLLASYPAWPAIFLIVIQGYRVFNLLRFTQKRLNENRLRSVCRRSSLVLGIVLILSLGLVLIQSRDIFSTGDLIAGVLLLALSYSLVLAWTLRKRLSESRLSLRAGFLSDSELPTLTVAIPARNETAALSDCIRSLLANDYSKLEILVVDDCSQDKTSDIIRKFAHKGVRFIKGTPPPKDWLAKNWAYKQLLDAANGKIVLFCGVDVRFGPQGLRQAVSGFKSNDLQMASILPRRVSEKPLEMIWQPMRYWRELTRPRAWRGGYPPALSTVWLADVDELKGLGGFDAYKKAIRPEHLFARNFDSKNRYRFLLNGSHLDVSSIKSPADQLETARRTRYPELKNRVEGVLLNSLVNSLLFILPVLAVTFGISAGESPIAVLGFLVFVVVIAIHEIILHAVSKKVRVSTVMAFPVIAICEVFVENYSMWAYEFSDVIWKGRNICLPVLQTMPRLPKLD